VTPCWSTNWARRAELTPPTSHDMRSEAVAGWVLARLNEPYDRKMRDRTKRLVVKKTPSSGPNAARVGPIEQTYASAGTEGKVTEVMGRKDEASESRDET